MVINALIKYARPRKTLGYESSPSALTRVLRRSNGSATPTCQSGIVSVESARFEIGESLIGKREWASLAAVCLDLPLPDWQALRWQRTRPG
jgi:hypothetical protein